MPDDGKEDKPVCYRNHISDQVAILLSFGCLDSREQVSGMLNIENRSDAYWAEVAYQTGQPSPDGEMHRVDRLSPIAQAFLLLQVRNLGSTYP